MDTFEQFRLERCTFWLWQDRSPDWFRDHLRIEPGDHEARLQLAHLLEMRLQGYDEAERLYQHVYEKISEVVCELPFNYSMADGLLYIARAKAQEVGVPQPAGS